MIELKLFLIICILKYESNNMREKKISTLMGLEPTTFGFEVQRAIHYATEPIYYIPCIKSNI